MASVSGPANTDFYTPPQPNGWELAKQLVGRVWEAFCGALRGMKEWCAGTSIATNCAQFGFFRGLSFFWGRGAEKAEIIWNYARNCWLGMSNETLEKEIAALQKENAALRESEARARADCLSMGQIWLNHEAARDLDAQAAGDHRESIQRQERLFAEQRELARRQEERQEQSRMEGSVVVEIHSPEQGLDELVRAWGKGQHQFEEHFTAFLDRADPSLQRQMEHLKVSLLLVQGTRDAISRRIQMAHLVRGMLPLGQPLAPIEGEL